MAAPEQMEWVHSYFEFVDVDVEFLFSGNYDAIMESSFDDLACEVVDSSIWSDGGHWGGLDKSG